MFLALKCLHAQNPVQDLLKLIERVVLKLQVTSGISKGSFPGERADPTCHPCGGLIGNAVSNLMSFLGFKNYETPIFFYGKTCILGQKSGTFGFCYVS